MKIDYWFEWVKIVLRNFIIFYKCYNWCIKSVEWIIYFFEDRWSLSFLFNYYIVDLFYLYSYGGYFFNNFVKIYLGIIKRVVNLIVILMVMIIFIG